METDQIRQTLRDEESRLAAMRDDIGSDDELDAGEQEPSGGELSTVDDHPAEIATEQNQREVSLSMLEQVEAEIDDVERAMRKLDEGTYGTCEACGKSIETERLDALPAARFCKDDQMQVEKKPQSARDGEDTAIGASEPI